MTNIISKLRPQKSLFASLSLLIALSATLTLSCFAAAPEEQEIRIQNHQFDPSQLTLPAGKKIKLTIKNLDNTPEEFESHSLNREKLIPAQSSTVIYIGPLKPGQYDFFGEFHPKTAQGMITITDK